MIIREATEKDFNEMDRLFKQLDGIHSDAHPEMFNKPIDHVRTAEMLSEIIQNENKILIVAVDDNHIVGIANAEIESAPNFPLFKKRKWLLISTIVVDETQRGKGIGNKLLDNLYEWAKKNNVHEAELTVYSFNESAIGFYEHNGFKEYKRKMRKKNI